VVSCADSRVPPEILFGVGVGVGDIFVVRVAGNVIGGADVSVKGSIEYAVAELNVPLNSRRGRPCSAVRPGGIASLPKGLSGACCSRSTRSRPRLIAALKETLDE
jgi:hypothetical protein